MLTAYAATASQVSDETVARLAWLVDLITERIPLWIAAFIVIVASLLIAKIARRMVESKLADSVEEENQELEILGGRIAYAVTLTIGITVGLKIGGIDLTTIIAAAAFGIGFALKDLIMNFLAGIMILINRPFSIGDFIKIGGTLGKIVEIQTRNTILQSIDGTKVIVPNGELFTSQVVNMTSNPFRRIEVEVGVDYRSDLDNALKVCMQTVRNTHGVLLEPKPAVLVSEWSDYEIVIKVRAWVNSRGPWLKIKSQLMVDLKKAFEEYNIDYAWPIVQLAYDKDQEHYKEKMLAEKKSADRIHITSQTPVAPAVAAPATPVTPAAPVADTAQPTASAPAMVDIEAGEEAEPLRPLGEQRPIDTKTLDNK